MKKLVLITVFGVLISTAVMGNFHYSPVAGKDTVGKSKKKYRQHAVHGREARMRLQLRQIKYHEKQIKKIDSAQKELDKEEHKSK